MRAPGSHAVTLVEKSPPWHPFTMRKEGRERSGAMSHCLAQAVVAADAPQKNSLGFSCDRADYPLKTFKRRQTMMVHIPKTGGTSLARWGVRSGYHFDRTDKKHRFVHMRDPASRDRANSTFRFSFVRNPYTRFVSQYTFCASGPHKTWNRGFPCHLVHKHNMPFDEWWAHLWRSILQVGHGQLPPINATPAVDFQAGHFDASGRPLSAKDSDDRKTTSMWCSGIWWGNCYGPVSQWVYENGRSGKRVVDWVGRLENFTSDFACLRQLLNDTKPGAPVFRPDGRTFHVRNSASATNGTRIRTRDWMRNESIRQLVLAHYADDFDNFGYPREVPSRA